MSLQFSDTDRLRGLVQMYEDEIDVSNGDISGNTTRLKKFTAKANLALDDFIRIALQASGRWQFDDSNHTDFPIISTNLVSGQRDYTFVVDESNNLVLDIYKVYIADESGFFKEVYPVDVNSGAEVASGTPGSGRTYVNGLDSFTDGQDTTGTPFRYDKLANGILLDSIPNYNYTNGLKVYVNREGSYFDYTDTAKKAGIPGLFHKYLYLKPAMEYARRNDLANYKQIQEQVIEMEGDEARGIVGTIAQYFTMRDKDVRKRLQPKVESNK